MLGCARISIDLDFTQNSITYASQFSSFYEADEATRRAA